MIHPICLLTFELIFRLFGDSRTDNCTTDWSHPAEWSALRLPLGRLSATSARPIAMLAIVAVLLAPSSRNGAATSQAPNATLTNRRARATSAVAMMATVITSAPTRWSLFAIAPSVPNTSLVSMRKAPITVLKVSVHGSATPRLASAHAAVGEADSASLVYSSHLSTASPLKQVRIHGWPRQWAPWGN